MNIRSEYPRPQFVRSNWQNLNGSWDFTFDDYDKGIEEKWYEGEKLFDQQIIVPFVYQSEESGINDRTPHDIVWYKKNIEIEKKNGERVILHFGAVDYETDIFINGQHVTTHIGGNTSFEVDITEYLISGTQTLVVRAFDPHAEETIPRGKQFWEAESRGIWYTNSTGIWQTVWLETVPQTYLKKARFTPLFDEGMVRINVELNRFEKKKRLSYKITFKDELIAAGQTEFLNKHVEFSVDLVQQYIFRTNFHDDGYSWTPENPNLFEVEFFLLEEDDSVADTVNSYFGFRKIHTEGSKVFLNNKPYYQKLILDQGYWPTGLLTAPNDEDFKKDILMAKKMGFNGCRKHQKVEDPRFLYWADQLGYLVWGECASPAMYSNESAERVMEEWSEIIDRDYNHPSIVTWVPINESWGVPQIHQNRQQQHFSQAMYHYLHSLDTTRLVISNDGWEMTVTDICAIHNYMHGQKNEVRKYAEFRRALATKENLVNRPSTSHSIYAKGFEYQGEPIILTEFGGIGFDVSGEPGWGYTSVDNEKEFIEDYSRIMDAIYDSEGLWGYCYTQLTDVEQEINGLLTYDRQPKCSLDKIKQINDQYHPTNL